MILAQRGQGICKEKRYSESDVACTHIPCAIFETFLPTSRSQEFKLFTRRGWIMRCRPLTLGARFILHRRVRDGIKEGQSGRLKKERRKWILCKGKTECNNKIHSESLKE